MLPIGTNGRDMLPIAPREAIALDALEAYSGQGYASSLGKVMGRVTTRHVFSTRVEASDVIGCV